MCEYICIYKIHIIRFENEQKLGLYRKSLKTQTVENPLNIKQF